MVTINIRMAKLKDWQQDPINYVMGPPKPDQGITVTPNLRLYPAVQEALRRINALGFDISSQQQAIWITSFLADKSIFRAIQDMTPDEYQQVFSAHINKTIQNPQTQVSMSDVTISDINKISMLKIVAQSKEMIELLELLMDIGFEMNRPSYAQRLLEELAKSKSQFGPIAAQMVQITINPASWEQLLSQAGEIQTTRPPSDSSYNPILQKELYPQETYNPDEVGPSNDVDYTPDENESTPQDIAPPAPAMPAMPTKTKGQGAAATSKQLKETVGKYEELKAAVPPEVKSLDWGDNSGIRINTQDGRGKDVAKGGMLLKNYVTTEDGIVVGVAPGNRLYVRIPPELGTAEWDPTKDDIRVSMHDKKWKPENF